MAAEQLQSAPTSQFSSDFIICRYVYRFVCDLQSLLGYTPEELHAMVDLQPLVKKEDDR